MSELSLFICFIKERTRLTSLAAVSHEKQNRLRDEDYDEKTPEELQTLLGILYLNNLKKFDLII